MNKFAGFIALLALLPGVDAGAACSGLRLAYLDQHRPPYYLGSGSDVPEPPGASVELLRDAVAASGCPLTLTRMPLRRLRSGLAAGAFDATPLEVLGDDVKHFAFPLDQNGKPDRLRALRLVTVVYVRAADKLPRQTNPAKYFRTHKLGAPLDSLHAAAARKAGLNIDDGAVDLVRNLEKLLLNRVDGVLVQLIEANDLDKFIASRYGADIVRLEIPLRENAIWLAFNKAWYETHQAQAHLMWQWAADNGQSQMQRLARKYGAGP